MTASITVEDLEKIVNAAKEAPDKPAIESRPDAWQTLTSLEPGTPAVVATINGTDLTVEKGADGSVSATGPISAQTACGLAVASFLFGLGGLAVAALAAANPGGVVISGVFLSAEMLNFSAAFLGAWGTAYGWVSTYVC